MTKTRTLAHAAILAAGFLVAPLFAAACPANMAKPFTAGPIAKDTGGRWSGPFSEWIVDSNGVGLQVCNDSVAGDGTPPPCFYDPVNPANAYTQRLTRGGEAFYFLADSVFTTTDAGGAPALDAVLVLGVESAFLSDPPAPGFETQFQRLRTRVNVAKVGVYYVETPWGKSRYVVDTLLPAGSGQNRSEISEPIDITFNPGSNAGLVTPFLVATNKGSLTGTPDADRYIGDGVTPSTVTGSPCGDNFVRVTAFGLDDATPLDINNGKNVVTSDTFTVVGKLAPAAGVPMAVQSSHYSVNAQKVRVNLMVEGSASPSASVSAAIPGALTPTVSLARDGARFFASTPVIGVPVPTTVAVATIDPGRPSTENKQNVTVTDLVSITRADATCTTTAGNRNCVLTVEASSSDDGSLPGRAAPVLTLINTNTPLAAGTVAFTSTGALPAAVTVRSTYGGSAVKPVTIINQ